MSGSSSDLYLSNPTLASALRRQQLAQSLVQPALSGSPTTGAGAWARAIQGLAGGLSYVGAQNDIDKAGADQQRQMSDFTDQIQKAVGGSAPQTSALGSALLPPAPVAPVSAPSPTAPLADRLNNPGNLKFAGQPGAVPSAETDATDGTHYAQFPDRATGSAALGTQLALYGRRGINTLSDLVNTYAPAKAGNDTGAYVQNLSQKTGFGPFDKIDLTDPAVQAKIAPALTAYEGGAKSIAGGGAPDPDATTPAVQPSPDVLAHTRSIQALALSAASSPNPMIRAQAPLLMQMAGQQLQSGKMVDATVNGMHGQQNTVTGEFKPYTTAAGRAVTDAHGNVIMLPPGGGAPSIVASNPSGISGNSPETNAARIVAEYTAKKTSGQPISSQEQANYETALPIYNAPRPITSGPGQQTTVVNTRDAPALPGAPSAGDGVAPDAAAQPGAPATTGQRVAVPIDTGKVAAIAQAGAQGSESGKNAAITMPQMVKLGTDAAQNIGTIDSAIAQVHSAAQAGIPTGYFTPALATAAAAAKSLGIDTSKLGVSPEGVTDIQAARKSLALTAGGILQQIIGKDSALTDSKIQQFIHATPGIETDPDALTKILGWARSQFVFNHDMALDAMNHADPATGMIPPGWQGQYFKNKGSFGPIYNPLVGEMQQPTGTGPSATAPAAAPTAAPPAPTMREGATATNPKTGAKVVFRGGQWVPM